MEFLVDLTTLEIFGNAPVKPKIVDFAVARHQLDELGTIIGDEVFAGRFACPILRSRPITKVRSRIVRVRPISRRVIQSHLQARVAERLHERLHQIAFGANGTGVEIVRLRGPEGEAVVMACSQDGIAHSGVLRERCPRGGVVVLRVEIPGIEAFVFVLGDALAVAHPFTTSCDRVGPPVDEHPVAGFVKPSVFLHILML